MTSSRDVRDMLGLTVGGDAQKAPVQKRPKATAPARTYKGVAREVAALYGERPPPVAVYEEQKSYRAKRQNTGPAKKWIQQPFTNPARADGLVLRHWRRKPTAPLAATNGEDTPMEDTEDGLELAVDPNYEFAKYNIQIEIPRFTDEEYDAHLMSNDWSREETDYLLGLIREYYYRWPIIYDRYEYTRSPKQEPSSQEGNANAQALSALPFAPSKARTMEDLKARFYEISAKLMRLRIPEVQMDADQYARYEILTKFDPSIERTRKNLASALMNRNLDDVKEEEFLLTELQRINMAANRLDAERNELRERLEAPLPNTQVTPVAAGLTSFQTSQTLTALFQQLFQQDRNKKRATNPNGPARLSLSATDIIGTPTGGTQHGPPNSATARRQTLPQPPVPPPVRQLNPAQEHRFNVSTHDRLQSGVTFGSDKLLKMRQAKSGVQTQKIAAALAQLGISELIAIPTSRVAEVFEKLVGKVSKLLDVRKVREKEEGECKILEAMKAQKAKVEGGENADAQKDGKEKELPDSQETHPDGDVDGRTDADGDGEEDPEADVDAEGEEDDDDDAGGGDSSTPRRPSEAVSTKSHKRSASVLSQTSNKSTKRVRK